MNRFFRYGLALLLLVATCATASAQSPSPELDLPSSTETPGGAPTLSDETKAVRARLETAKAELDQHRASLSRHSLSNAELQDLRQRVEPVAERLRRIVAAVSPQTEAAKARLDQLGPRPKDIEESADVARDRAARESAMAASDETGRLARTLLLESEQVAGLIGDRRRAMFTRALFERSAGVLGGGLWAPAVQSLPGDVAAFGTVMSDLGRRVARDASLATLMIVALALGLALALHFGRSRLAPRLIRRDAAESNAPRRRVLRSAGMVLIVEALPAAIGSLLFYGAVETSGMMPARLMPALISALTGLVFVAFMRALAEAVLAPDRMSWRLVRLSDDAAARTFRFVIGVAVIVALGKFAESLFQVIGAALPLTVLTRAFFATAAALAVAELLRRFAPTVPSDDDCLGPYIPPEPEVGGPVRIVGWAIVGLVLAGASAGYVALASFLIDQMVWVGILLALLILLLPMADEFIGGTLRGQTRFATTLQSNTGLRRKSLEQIGVLLNGVARVVLFLVAAFLALAPWGVESTDLLSSVRAAFFGFQVGDVTVSVSTVVFGVALFGIGFLATRIVQSWLEKTFLPTTELDAGLRNSISTAFGYLGFFAAAALAFSYLGLGLDKIAIVAGALSVGIGFGLQSIVNNFVSGLILLWERPIRVGDLVVVGDGEGHVRRISVRATEIETFDRSTIIVPNSNLISGVVRNRVRGDRSGRVVIPVNVMRNQDPARAAELLVSCAATHADIMNEPPPRVFFKKIGDTSLEFELVCFVPDVNTQGRVQSELNFAVFKCLVDEGIIPPLGPGATTVLGLEPVQGALDHIAEALARRKATGKPAGSV